MASELNFSSVPVLDFKLSQSPSTKQKFLSDLLYAVSHVGFLYLANPPVPALPDLLPYIPKIFDLPQEAKDRIDMANSPHFFGYTKLGKELTKGAIDQREQFDFGTPIVCRWKEGDPDHYKAWGPSQVSHVFCCLFMSYILPN
jgi:isopenicillin N synthase-like dioxygenase